MKLMACGCTGMTQHTQAHDGLPANHPCCFTHMCCEVESTPINLEGRRARCAFFGKTPRKNECDHCRSTSVCSCERDSKVDLAFFVHHPTKEFDEFYCGCHSWD